MKIEMKIVQLENIRILVVDDDKKISDTLSLILESRGYNVDVANTGKIALEKSKANKYNLAVLDIKLPDIDGTKLLKSMHEISPNIIRIILTGYPQLKNVITALNEGVDAYFTKPVDPARLIKTIEEKLEEQAGSDRDIEERAEGNTSSAAEELPSQEIE
jgi:DNA-binding NtrC family response regulator